MSETRVVNVRHEPCDVYIGRTLGDFVDCGWGNPFRLYRDGGRKAVIEQYRRYIQAKPDLVARLPELRGKRLGCWCAPKPCHGDVLVELVNALPPEAPK